MPNHLQTLRQALDCVYMWEYVYEEWFKMRNGWNDDLYGFPGVLIAVGHFFDSFIREMN